MKILGEPPTPAEWQMLNAPPFSIPLPVDPHPDNPHLKGSP